MVSIVCFQNDSKENIINNIHFTKSFSIFVIIVSFMLSSCSEDPSFLGDEPKKKQPEKIDKTDKNTTNNKLKETTNQEINTSIQGILIDGYIKNATICIDKNNDGLCTIEKTTKTNDKGEFSLSLSAKPREHYTIIGTGGIDTATNIKFNGTYKNVIKIKNSTQHINITPITTIVSHLYNTNKKPIHYI